ncbi:bifunctional helix-turn-helix transcriptional regulator/GNAT family N-acetyltransferase [Devosia sp. A16]|uniref:bifunctional helix-turn-helix transcriptional regulator/GNAT family N-acetyltransferase n=1 Tax=Devosia sp. A16 TaxID=1736675 RepID=UPI0006D7B253|nr:bifunctional helix-turn-helix transcriptional regulator/GNAT family N-acetyltransferase [Devosia sp. A16]
MTYLGDMGLLSLGSQLKAVSDQLYAMADEVYARHGIALQGRWFPILRLLHDRGPMMVGEIAAAVGQTHSAISQLTTRLVRDGWVSTASDAGDRRTRRLTLTARAEAALQAAKPLWRAMRDGLEERVRSAGLDPETLLAGLEQMAAPGLADNIAAKAREQQQEIVRIVPLNPELRTHFYRLNAIWLEHYFELEPYDIEVMSNPEAIVEHGGAVLFAQLGDTVVGTCALKQHAPGEYELTKMGVDPASRGFGIGRKLIEAAIGEFERLGGGQLYLETNSRLESAIHLYERTGFEHQPAVREGSSYGRANVYMIWRGRAAVAA